MTNDRWFIEFEGKIDSEGRIVVPEEVREALPVHPGPVYIRLSGVMAMRELLGRGVTAEEISAIARLQASGEREVYRMLLAEGSLKGTPFAARAESWPGGGEP